MKVSLDLTPSVADVPDVFSVYLPSAVAFLHDVVVFPNVNLVQPTATGSSAVVSDYGVVTAAADAAPPRGLLAELRLGEDKSSFLGSFAYEISQHRCYAREADGLVNLIAF